MRAFVDANVFISNLLAPSSKSPPILLTEAAISRGYTLLLTDGVIAEVVRKTETKPYLVRHINPSQMERLIAVLRAVAEWVPELDPPLPQVGRDRKDDYLFAHAVFGEADFLISGDFGVQKIGRIGNVEIMSPAGFVRILQESGRLPQET